MIRRFKVSVVWACNLFGWSVFGKKSWTQEKVRVICHSAPEALCGMLRLGAEFLLPPSSLTLFLSATGISLLPRINN